MLQHVCLVITGESVIPGFTHQKNIQFNTSNLFTILFRYKNDRWTEIALSDYQIAKNEEWKITKNTEVTKRWNFLIGTSLFSLLCLFVYWFSTIYLRPRRATGLQFTAWWTQQTRLSVQRFRESLCGCRPSRPNDRPSFSPRLKAQFELAYITR